MFSNRNTLRIPDAARILLVRTDRMGDVILTLPMIAQLRKRFPRAHLAMLIRRYAGPLVHGHPDLNEILWYDDGNEQVPFFRLVGRLRSGNYDVVILVHPTARLALLAAMAGIPLRIGSGYRWYSFLLNRPIREHRKDAKRHEAEYNMNLLAGLGGEPPAFPFVPDFGIHVSPEAAAELDAILGAEGVSERDVVVLHPGSGGSARDWPLRHFAVLAGRLSVQPEVRVIVTGSAEEKEKAEQVVALTGGRGVMLAGRLTLSQLTALLARACLMVANSTGPLHLAAALGTPVVGFYPQHPAMSARRWGPYTTRKYTFTPDRPTDCSDCRSSATMECACMASIDVEPVVDACLELLRQGVTADAKEGRRAG